MPQQVLFYRYTIRNPAFGKKYKKVWESLPYSVQARAKRLGERFKRDILKLQKEGYSISQIAGKFGVYKSTIDKTLSRMRDESAASVRKVRLKQ